MNPDINDFIRNISTLWEPVKKSLTDKVVKEFENLHKEREFKIENEKEIILNDILHTYGVYCFYIKFSEQITIDKFRELWDKDNIEYQPKVSLKRFTEIKKDDWSVLYVGKSENLNKRIHQHVNLPVTSTFALKLRRRNNLNTIASYRLVWYALDGIEKESDKNIIQFILTNLESELRNSMKPIIGKQ